MATLHLVQGDSAAGSLRQAFQAAECEDEIAVLMDDLSCGPINRTDAAARIGWWGQYWEELRDQTPRLAAFWSRLDGLERVVVWAGRARASEHCFLLAVAQVLPGRGFGLIACEAGSAGVDPESAGCVAFQRPEVLRGLIGTERWVGPEEQAAMSVRWDALRQENAPFRVVRKGAVVSVGKEYFDAVLLAEARREPLRAARVVGGAMGREPAEMQVGDRMLTARLVALVEAGRLMADGDPWDLRTCRVWLPG